MVLKVAGDFSNFPDIMSELDKYNYTFINNMMYISDVNSHKSFRSKIQKLFNSNCYVAEVDRKSLKLEPMNAQSWCEKQIAWAALIKFEKNQQESLSKTMEILDDIDKKIDQYIIERGDTDGRDGKEKERQTSEEETGG